MNIEMTSLRVYSGKIAPSDGPTTFTLQLQWNLPEIPRIVLFSKDGQFEGEYIMFDYEKMTTSNGKQEA